MDIPLQRSSAIGRAVIALWLGLCGAVQAGMQLQPVPAAEPAPMAAPALAPAAAAPQPRPSASPAPAPTQRPGEKTAWTPCIRLINAAALGAAIDAERRQALLEQCAP